MKKLLVILMCLMAVFVIASCKQDPKNAEPTPAPTPAPEPEPMPSEPGVLRISPAEGATFSQDGKFQFTLAIEYNPGEPIEFLLKCSDAITGVEAREGGNGDTFFIPKNTPITEWEKNAEGWYIISIPGENVVPIAEPCYSLGITTRLPNDSRSDCFVEIKNLKINDVLVDFTDYIDDEDFVGSYVTCPDALDVKIGE